MGVSGDGFGGVGGGACSVVHGGAGGGGQRGGGAASAVIRACGKKVDSSTLLGYDFTNIPCC